MLDDMKAMMRDMNSDDEVFTLLAKGMRKLYEALVAEGFTQTEAVQIIAGQGMNIGSNG